VTRPLRIGVLIPSTNQVVEPDFARMVPEGVTFHTERLWNGSDTPPGGGDGTYLQGMNQDIDRAVRYLASANLNIVAYCCTSGTYHAGDIDYNGKISTQIEKVGGLPAVTAVTASLEAFEQVKAKRLSLVGPYGNFLLQEKLTPLLESQGYQVVKAQGEEQMLQRTNDSTIGDQSPEYIVDFVSQADHGDADTVFLPGTAWRALEIVEELEKRLGRTVITVNQATIWATFKRLGVLPTVQGYGRLLAPEIN
jgi:maleate isomerase